MQKLILTVLITISSITSLAKDRILISTPSYALGFAADLFIKNIAPRISQNYRIIRDEKNIIRINRLLANIYLYSGHNFIYPKYQVTIIQGDKSEPNAFTSGKNIYVTQELCNLLNDRELTAVIAHEMAHSERSHLLRRIVFTIGSPFLAVYNYIANTGATDNPQEILAEARLGTEIEADCIAAKWLMSMRNQGKWHHAEDLNRATAKLFGGVEYLNYLDANDPPVTRFWAVRNKLYEVDSCGL